MKAWRLAVWALALPATATGAEADWITSWGEGTPGIDFLVVQDEGTVRILTGNGKVYKFYSETFQGSGVPGVINNITVHAEATGDFTLLIEHEFGGPGAQDWNEGNLEYTAGTSTVIGIKVAGVLAEPGKSVVFERLDGSIEVGGSVETLTIGEWASPSPAKIAVQGSAQQITVNSTCRADIQIGGDLCGLTINGHFCGSMDVEGGLTGLVEINGRVGGPDGGETHIQVNGALTGTFECEQMYQGAEHGRDTWLTFGPAVFDPGVVHTGNVNINDVLRGVLHFRSPCAATITVREIDAMPVADPDLQYGGIYFGGGSLEDCYVSVTERFREGWIYADCEPTSGLIRVDGHLGWWGETVARILTGWTAEPDPQPVDFGWKVRVWAIYSSADELPAIHAAGALLESIGALTVASGAEVRIEGDVLAGGSIGADFVHGEVSVGGDCAGMVQTAFLESSGRITVRGDVTGSICFPLGSLRGEVEVFGDLRGWIYSVFSPGAITGGRIHVHGSFGEDAYIWFQELTGAGAIAIDYDGWHVDDEWISGAWVRIGDTEYYGNTPEMKIWEIQPCKGDMNNNGDLDPNDPNILSDAIEDPNQYAANFPGLEGSLWWHGDLDCDGDRDAVDLGALAFFAGDPNNTCCLDDPNCEQYEECRADLNRDGLVDVSDLAELLAAYESCVGDPNYNPDADFDASGCVDLSDLSFLLSVYGELCDCFGGGRDGGEGGGSGGESRTPQGMNLSIEPFDTHGYRGGGFAGESSHFVFDLLIESTDAANDWTTTGVVASAQNGAVFRLASEPTNSNPYASFVSAPRRVDADGPDDDSDATVAGAYLPSDAECGFEASVVNVCWFDEVESDDGPAAILRLVIDVSSVGGADTSGGLGSVYFSQTGPGNAGDIKVADFNSLTSGRLAPTTAVAHDGAFYVVGQ